MKHPEIFFRTSEFEDIKTNYQFKKKLIDSEVEQYFANTNNLDALYNKVMWLSNSKEILATFPNNMVALGEGRISNRNLWQLEANPFLSSSYGFNPTSSKSIFFIGLMVVLLFIIALTKKWRTRHILGILSLVLIGWNITNYNVKEPEFLAKPQFYINENEYRNEQMHEAAKQKLAELYKPRYMNYSQSQNTYEYDVEGENSLGNYVSGHVETNDESGSGYVFDENFNRIEIEVEWISGGELLGTDEDGNHYGLIVND